MSTSLSVSPSVNTLRHWLALWRIPGIGSVRFLQLLQFFPNIEDVFRTSPTQLSALGFSVAMIAALQKPDWAVIDSDLQWAEQENNYILLYSDPRYPPLLKQIAAAPVVLFVQGDVAVLQSHQLAMVGSRNPSPTGSDIARQFAQYLSVSGLTITSGLALGIDGASHRGALENQGKTIAVLGTGLDYVYPRSHQKLAAEIAIQGALVSEYPLGTPPKATHFPQRNRIVCGLSLGVLVVEATLRSGSLITARLAAEQGREVFAIPGSIHNPLSRGCHFLIRQGAKLVETAQDILEELGALAAAFVTDAPNPVYLSFSKEAMRGLDADQQKLLDCIGFEATTVDQLVARTGLAAHVVASMVLMLELREIISSVPGGYTRNS